MPDTQPPTTTFEPSGEGTTATATPTALDAAADSAAPPAPPTVRDSLLGQLHEAQAQLTESRRYLDHARRERDIHRALYDAGAFDLDAAAALLSQSLTTTEAPDTKALITAVTDLKRRKPHLFKPAARTNGAPPAPRSTAHSPTASAMSPRSSTDTPTSPLTRAAALATTGDRSALMSYLRLRRANA